MFDFNSHASCEAWLGLPVTMLTADEISTHTPHARRDLTGILSPVVLVLFQLTRLMRGVTASKRAWTRIVIFQLTRLMRGVTYHSQVYYFFTDVISTHTPHARRDVNKLMRSASSTISTHTPHARRDAASPIERFISLNFNSHASCEAWQNRLWLQLFAVQFQLTRLMRGVTTPILIKMKTK